METDWIWDRLDPIEQRVAKLLLEGKNNKVICAEVSLSRSRVQECMKRIVIKAGAGSTREVLVLLAQERETLSLLHVLEQATDGVGIVQDRVCKFVNKAMAEIFGYDPEEMVGIPFVELLARDAGDRTSQHYEQRMQGIQFPRTYWVRIRCKDGQEKDIRIAGGGLIRYMGRPAILGIAVQSQRGGAP